MKAGVVEQCKCCTVCLMALLSWSVLGLLLKGVIQSHLLSHAVFVLPFKLALGAGAPS